MGGFESFINCKIQKKNLYTFRSPYLRRSGESYLTKSIPEEKAKRVAADHVPYSN